MGIIHRAFKVRIYPTLEQEVLINKTLGCSRKIFNLMLAEHIQVYELLKDDKEKLYTYKYKTEKEYKEEFPFLKEVDSVALQQSHRDLNTAYNNFFKSLKGQRKGKSSFPKFKKKRNSCSYRTVMNNPTSIQIDSTLSKIKLQKLSWIKYCNKRLPPIGIIKSATVSRSSTGKYYVSVLFECELELEPTVLSPNLKIKGLDMSMEKFYVDELGNSPQYERIYRKYEPDLKRLQRSLARKKKGSHNWYKNLMKINAIHEKISNKRNDFTQKLSKKLVMENDIIVVEDLNMKSMSQCLNLGKSVNDLGYGEFVRQLTYKSLWNGKTLIKADRWFASSKTCSHCGYRKTDLTLDERVWTCPSCGKVLDRDMNAALNLQKIGREYFDLDNIGQELPEFKPVEKKTSGLELNNSNLSHASLKQECRKAEPLGV